MLGAVFVLWLYATLYAWRCWQERREGEFSMDIGSGGAKRIVQGGRGSSTPSRAIMFDVEAASLASLREALLGWEIEMINGATSATLAPHWDPGAADLLVVSARGQAADTLALCRFLAFCTDYSTEARGEGAEAPDARENLPAVRPHAALLVLVPPGQEALVGPALEAGARNCLVLPIHTKDVARMLAHAKVGNQPGRHTLNLDQAQTEDLWRDDGGQG